MENVLKDISPVIQMIIVMAAFSLLPFIFVAMTPFLRFTIVFSSASGSLLPPFRSRHRTACDVHHPGKSIQSSVHHAPAHAVPPLGEAVCHTPCSGIPRKSKFRRESRM